MQSAQRAETSDGQTSTKQALVLGLTVSEREGNMNEKNSH